MNTKPIVAYFVILIVLCSCFVVGARVLGEQSAYLAQGYMLTPAIAALLTRLFFYPPRFNDAYLRIGRTRDYVTFWLAALGITGLSYLLYTILGAISWDFTGEVFLGRLAEQFAQSGQDMTERLPPGFTPQMMLWLFFIGGLTVFNVLPGLITGFGEEFGHRGFMFPQLYRIKPWVGLIVGGLIWYAWHLPLALIIPSQNEMPPGTSLLNFAILAIGSVCTFTYLAYVYVRCRSVFVTSIAHIAMNNAATAFSYFVVIRNQLLANAGLTLAMVIVAAALHFSGRLGIFAAAVGSSTE